MKLINSPIYTERIRRFTVKREGCQLKTLRSSPISLFVGVETARYRIRKKLAIPGNINLVDFLIDLKSAKAISMAISIAVKRF